MLWLRSRWVHAPLSLSLSLSLALAWALMLAYAFPAVAQEEPPPEAVEPSADTARFLIETITVETDREASVGIIKSETLLKEGETYTQDDLRQAVARVHRLPFVLDADFSLRKRDERGAYELVIQAYTDRWFSYARQVRISRFDGAFALGGTYSHQDGYATSHTAGIGGSMFVGRSGMLYGSIGFHEDLAGDDSGPHLGYTQYNLFGRGIVANLTYGACCDSEVIPFGMDPKFPSWQWLEGDQYGLSLAIPISAERSIQVGWTEAQIEAWDRRSFLDPYGDLIHFETWGSDQSSRRLYARWVHDTSDDPVLPSRGTVLSAGLEYYRYETGTLRSREYFRDQLPIEVELPSFDEEQIAAVFDATRHWSVTPRQSISAGGRLSVGRSQVKNRRLGDWTFSDDGRAFYAGAVSAGHLLRLWSLREPGNAQDLYLETAVTYRTGTGAPRIEFPNDPLARLNASTGLTYRTPWGRLRLTFTFLDHG